MKNIEYRIADLEEKIQVRQQQNITWPRSDVPADDEALRKSIAEEKIYGNLTYCAAGEGGLVAAGMDAETYTIWFDGQRVPMTGIAGVVSKPEHRRCGHVRRIFEKVFEDIYENGTVFSHLYPFSHSYYRQFGYEQCGYAYRYTLPVAPARKINSSGTAHEFSNSDDERSKLIEVYETFASRHNLMLSRKEGIWKDVFDVSPYSEDRIYYWKNTGAAIKSWAKFKKKDKTIDIRDIVWADHEGMLGILQFIGMFEGHADEMKVLPGPELIPELYWDDPYNIKTETMHLGMNRVVNAKLALKLLEKPSDAGGFTVKISDTFARWNNNTYKVEYGAGEGSVIETGESDADIETNERAFMQLLLGCYSLKQLDSAGLVQVNGNTPVLEKVFIRKPMLITDYF